MNNNWRTKRVKREYQPPSLFNIAAAVIANHEIKDKFAWKLISQHKEEVYECIYEVCDRCINWGLDNCVNHKLNHSRSFVRGSSLEFADYIAVLPFYKFK